jgi:hypothetical protein
MTITVVGTATAVSGASNVTQLSLTVPGGIADRDVACIFAIKNDDLSGDWFADGFENLSNLATTTGIDGNAGVLLRVILDASTEPSSWVVENADSDRMAAVCVVLRGVHPGDPVDVLGTFTVDVAADVPDTPSSVEVTTTRDGSFVLRFCGFVTQSTNSGSLAGPASPAGTTVVTAATTAGTASQCVAGAHGFEQASPGATGTDDWTATAIGTGSSILMRQTLALRDFVPLPDPVWPETAAPERRTPWSIDLCNGWQRIGTVDAYEFTGVTRNHELGEWALSCAAGSVEWGTFEGEDGTDHYRPEDVDTIRLVEGRTIRFAGYVGAPTGASSGTGGLDRVQALDGERLTWSGPDLWDVLERRVAYPNPATGPPWSVSHDERSGQASTALAGYLVDNLGNTAHPHRQIPGFAVIDGNVGPSGEWSARLQTLGALTRRICSDAGITCRLSVSFDGEITATITEGRDLSGTWTLSDQGDLVSIVTREVPETATLVIAGGQGEGTARVFRFSNAGDEGEARREVFSDQSALAAASEVQLAAAATLAAGGATWSVQAETTDETASLLAVGVDVQIGDRVAAIVAGRRFVVPITAATFEVTAGRQVVRPTLGTAVPDELTGLIRDVAGLTSRLDTTIA